MESNEILGLIDSGTFLDTVVNIVWEDMKRSKKTARRNDAKLFVGWILYNRKYDGARAAPRNLWQNMRIFALL